MEGCREGVGDVSKILGKVSERCRKFLFRGDDGQQLHSISMVLLDFRGPFCHIFTLVGENEPPHETILTGRYSLGNEKKPPKTRKSPRLA